MTPYCQAYHYESISRGEDKTQEEKDRFSKEVSYVLETHHEILKNGDPCFNINLVNNFDSLSCSNTYKYLRIAILCIRMQKGFGVDLVVSEQAKLLTANGFHVDIYTLEKDDYFDGSEYCVYEVSDAHEVIKRVNSERYDVVMAHTTPFFELLPSVRKDTYTIAYEHGDPNPELFGSSEVQARQAIKDYKLKKVYPIVNEVLAISEFIVEDIHWKNSKVIHNGSDHLLRYYENNKNSIDTLNLVDKYNIDTKKIIISNVTRLGTGESNYKGLDHFLDMIALLDSNKYEFVVLGKGEESDKLALEKQSIKVILNASREELIKTYLISDLFVSFSKWEGFNLPLVEAQTFSKPAFALDRCAHPEVCENVYVSLENLVSSIKKEDKISLKNLGKKSKDFIDQFTWKKNVDKLADTLMQSYKKFEQGSDVKPGAYVKDLVSICILTKDKYEYISECIESILQYSDDYKIEILIGDTGSTDPQVLEFYKNLDDERVGLHYLNFYHFSKNNNTLAQKAQGEFVLFLNNDTKLINANWLDLMIKPFSLKETGIVGPKLLFRDETIQHAGVEIFTREPYRYVGWHPYSAFDKNVYDANITKIMPAVTGACLLMRHELFDKVGGFNEAYAEECQDIDLCFKAALEGYQCIYTPKVELFHYENGTRTMSESSADRNYFISIWETYIDENIFNTSQQSKALNYQVLINLEGKEMSKINTFIEEEKKITEDIHITFKYPFHKKIQKPWIDLVKEHQARLLKDDYEDNIKYDYIY
ncbi:glycosyltransferase [Sulfurimonas sp. MAG313]|nr:glycosyltransferase [Sulfurimonas sp. MAG313]MDF1881755.1 glycosyltransferase [Sulfurimonas sp. MAG313]